MNDSTLWKIYSEYIRIRDADENGYCTCITSGRLIHWKLCDAGHFISRRHKATKFHEQNVNAQGRFDNRFNAGNQYAYSKAIDQKYGPGTADKILVMSRMTCKRDQFEIDVMTKYYKKLVDELKKEKHL